MVELTDSNRRLLIFVTIVLGGSILLIFDIPVLYLMMAVIFLALALLVITGTLILSEVIHDLFIRFKSRPKKEKKPKPKKEKTKSNGKGSILKGFSFKMPALPSLSLPKSAPKEKKEKPKEAAKKKAETTPSPASVEEDEDAPSRPESKDEDIDIDLEGLDLDEGLDIDAELDAVNPEFDNIRTPYGETAVLDDLPSEDAVKKMDIATKDEEDDIILDTEDVSDDLDDIYSSTIDIGSDGGDDIITSMEGGDSISSSDLASYSSSESSPYNYGGDEGESEGEEQFELSGRPGGGLGDDDLIASLKADIEDLKKKDDDVLLRDLKDIRVSAEELAEELKEIMDIISRKARKK